MEPRELLLSIGASSSPAELRTFLDHPDAEEAHVLALLRKRHLSALVLETLSRHERWGTRHGVRAAIVCHPMTPRTVSMRLLGHLRWSGLLRVALNHRLEMPLQ